MRRERGVYIEREWGTVKIYTSLGYDIFSEPFFFALPPRGWHRADFKHLIIFVPLHSKVILVFDISKSCAFSLFSTSQPETVCPLLYPGPTPKMALHLVSPLLCLLITAQGWKLSRYVFFRWSHTTFLSTCHPSNSRGISTVFCSL